MAVRPRRLVWWTTGESLEGWRYQTGWFFSTKFLISSLKYLWNARLKLLLIWNPQQNSPKMLFSHSKQTTGNRAMLYSFLTQQNCCLKKSLRISCFLRTDVAIMDLTRFCVSFLVVSTITKRNQNCLKAGEPSKRMHSCTRLNILLCSFPAQCWHYWPLIEKLCMTDSSK